METFGERLHDAMMATGVSISGLAKHCRVSRHTVEKWLVMPEADPPAKLIALASGRLHCRLMWLAMGTGPVELILEDPEIAAIVERAMKERS